MSDLDLTAAVEAAAVATWSRAPMSKLRPWDVMPEAFQERIRAEVPRDLIAAVAPIIEAQVRERVAAEIEAGENWTPEGPLSCYGCPVCPDPWESEPTCTHRPAIEWAARIARGQR